MATVFGKIEEFDSSHKDWPEYMEMLGYFFDANGIVCAEKKRAVLLTLIGATTYKLLRSVVAPSKPAEKIYQELTAALTAHFSPLLRLSCANSSFTPVAVSRASLLLCSSLNFALCQGTVVLATHWRICCEID